MCASNVMKPKRVEGRKEGRKCDKIGVELEEEKIQLAPRH